MDLLSAPADVAHIDHVTHQLSIRDAIITLADDGTIRMDTVELSLPPMARKIFAEIIRAESGVVSPEKLINTLHRPDRQRIPDHESIRTHVSHVRSVLEQNRSGASDLIKTSSAGYYVDRKSYTYPVVLLEHAMITIDNLSIRFPSSGGIIVNEQAVHLTRMQTFVLRMLCEAGGRVCTWEAFATRTYGPNRSKWPDSKILDVFVCNLRRTLYAACNRKLIETAWGRGYRLTVDLASPIIPPRASPEPQIKGPTGLSITLRDLPNPSSSARWVMSRKAIVIALIKGGAITIDDVLGYYQTLSKEELVGWMTDADKHGMKALRVTKSNLY